MANLFRHPCDLSRGRDRVFANKCPLWCPDHGVTEEWSLDFTAFPRNEFDEVVETAEIADSLGHIWHWAGGFDANNPIADYNVDTVFPSALTISGAMANGGGPVLQPKYPWAVPHFNRNYAWTMLWEVYVGSGNTSFFAQSLDVGGDAKNVDCAYITRMSVSDTATIGQVIYSAAMSDLCSGANESDVGELRIYNVTDLFNCHVLAVDPCAHEYFQQTRIIGDEDLAGFPATTWREGDAPNTDKHAEWDINCGNWPDIDGDIYPSRWLGSYNKYQTMKFTFSAAAFVSVKSFKMWPRKLSLAEIAAVCPLAS